MLKGTGRSRFFLSRLLANDPRLIKAESDELVEAVRKNGVPVAYVVFADEGHGFSKKKNSMEAHRKILELLDRYLKKS